MARKSRKGAESVVPPIAEPSYRVGAYVRLSAIDRKQKGDSIENQQAIISAFIMERPDLALTDVYIDNGLSGQTFERPAFQRMLADFASGKITCCVTKDLSRLGRNAIDAGYYIEKYFPSNNIRYIAINDNYDSADGSAGGIMVSLRNLVNEVYALEIGRKIHESKQMNIKNGCFIGRFSPYGYLKSSDDGHKLVVDGYAAPIVRHMFDMAAGGKGVSSIVDWLNGSSIMPPRRYFHSIGLATEKEASGHVHWNKGVVYAILKNRIYVGDMIQGKFDTHSYVQVKRQESEWVVTKNTHDGIVSRELFEKVQGMRKSCTKPPAINDGGNIFLRKIFCGHCGHALRRSHNRKFCSFCCTTNSDYSKGDCKVVRINENALKSILLETLRAKASVLLDNKPVNVQKPAYNAELRDVQTEIDRNSGFLKGLYENLFTGIITESEYREMKQSYEDRISALAEKERQLRESARLAALDCAKRGKAADVIGTVFREDGLTAAAIDALVDRILVFEDKHVEFTFKFLDGTVRKDGAANA